MEGRHAVASAPVEKKVQAATSAAFLVGIGIALLNWAVGDSQLMGSLPSWAQAAVTLLAPPLLTFLSGWKAQHTHRPDLADPAAEV